MGPQDIQQHQHVHHHDDHHDHIHESREEIERNAIIKEEMEDNDLKFPFKSLAEALIRISIDKKFIDPRELRRMIEHVDEMNENRGGWGRKVVVRAWLDEQFREALVKNMNST